MKITPKKGQHWQEKPAGRLLRIVRVGPREIMAETLIAVGRGWTPVYGDGFSSVPRQNWHKQFRRV
jgi:hypothetical protein